MTVELCELILRRLISTSWITMIALVSLPLTASGDLVIDTFDDLTSI